MKKPTMILTADWHARSDKPVCRLEEDYLQSQINKWRKVNTLQKRYKCPILHAGDLFDGWKPSPYLLSKMLEFLPNEFYTIPGNHDLPAHKIDRLDESGLHVLQQAGLITVLCDKEINSKNIPSPSGAPNFVVHPFPWGAQITPPSSKIKSAYSVIAVAHAEVWAGKPPYPGADTKGEALRFLKAHPEYDLILTGHNHAPFVVEHQGRMLVNPGSIMRMDADQIDHKPRVYLWFAETNTVEEVFLPIKNGVVSREHIEIKEERNQRLEAFISRLKTSRRVSLHFETNVEQFFAANEIRQPIVDMTWEFIQGGEDNK